MIYVTSTQRRLTLSIGLLASVGDVRAMPARLPGYAPDTSFVNFHVTEITCPAPWDCQPRSVTRTTCDDLRHQHPAPPHSAPISSLPPRSASIGHGGTGEMTVTNPFVFIVQVRRQYDYCIRSGDPFLLVLPCPRLCCAFASVLLFLRKLLLLAGDIESNPGPDLAQIAKQLKEVAVDIKEIKEGRLADMDKKLDALSRLEPKITSCVKQIEDMHLITKNLEKRMDDLENQSRRSNIIVYGLAETEQENSEKLEQAAAVEATAHKPPYCCQSVQGPKHLPDGGFTEQERTTMLQPAQALFVNSGALYFLEQLNRFRHHHCTGGSTFDVVATPEHAKTTGCVVTVVLLDVGTRAEEKISKIFNHAFLTGRTVQAAVEATAHKPPYCCQSVQGPKHLPDGGFTEQERTTMLQPAQALFVNSGALVR
nr:uncharacterized protein LOC119169778 [Rhipicephalus microplus]